MPIKRALNGVSASHRTGHEGVVKLLVRVVRRILKDSVPELEFCRLGRDSIERAGDGHWILSEVPEEIVTDLRRPCTPIRG